MDTRSSFQLRLAICIFSITSLYAAKAKKCDPGFYLDTEKNCTDDNECGDNENTSSARCGAHTDCYNTQGSFYCTCKKGFFNSSKKTNFTSRMNCNDINECVTNPCDSNAECTNAFGSFKCTCKKGFTPGEHTFTNKTKTGCQNVNECLNVMEHCGPNANCVDTLGSFNCSCKNGFVSTGEATFTNKTKIQCKALESLRPRSSSFQDVNTFVEQSIKSLLKLENRNSEEFRRLISNFLNIIENYSIKAARNLSHEEIKDFSTDQFDVIIQAIRNNTIPKGRRAKLATANNSMDIDWNSVAGKESFDVAAAALISVKQLDRLMGTNISNSTDNKTKLELISEVVTATVTNKDKENLAGNVILTFKHKKYNNQTTKCVYWDNLASVWSTHGCMLQHSNATHTVCTCTHLSSFAVLMALYEIKGPHIYNLDMITIVGIIFSLVCLFISILTFTLCRSIKSVRTTIHTHLCLNLFLAGLLFLIGISRTENKTGCAIIGGFLHYLFLTSFAWMLLEGVQLYLMVVKVFNAKSLQLKYMCLFGYGFPLLVVGISAAAYAQGYGTKEYCWLDLKSGFIWAFLIPVSLIILVNAGFFIITVWRLVDKFSSLNPDMNELKKIRAFTITAVAQLCLLGCMWIFGILHFQENTIAMTYVFTIINSLQGVFIFTLHCLFNKQVRDEYAKILVSICHMKKASKYSEFSTSSTQGLKSTHETGM